MRRAAAGPGGSRGAAEQCQRCRHSSGRIPLPLSSAGEPRAQQRGLPPKAPGPQRTHPSGTTLDIASQGEKKPRGVCLESLLPNRPLGREKGIFAAVCPFVELYEAALPRGRAALARPRSWTRCRAALPGGARSAPQPGGFKQKGWSLGSLVGFYYFFFSFQKTTATLFWENFFFPLPPPGPLDHCVLALLPLVSDWHASRTEEFFFPLFYYLFICLFNLTFFPLHISAPAPRTL